MQRTHKLVSLISLIIISLIIKVHGAVTLTFQLITFQRTKKEDKKSPIVLSKERCGGRFLSSFCIVLAVKKIFLRGFEHGK